MTAVLVPRHPAAGPGQRANAEPCAGSFAGWFPDGGTLSYWHRELPVDAWLAGGDNIAGKSLRDCAQAAIDAAHALTLAKPAGRTGARVMAILAVPHMAGSQLCVIFDEHHYACLTSQHLHSREWLPLPATRSLAREWGLCLPPGYGERGFRDLARTDAPNAVATGDGEIWLIGEV